jgi:hypothetical protein
LRIELWHNSRRLIGPSQIAAPHQVTATAWRNGLNWTGPFQATRSNREPELPVTHMEVNAPGVDADHEAASGHVLVAEHRPVVGGDLAELRHVTRVCQAGCRFDQGGS